MTTLRSLLAAACNALTSDPPITQAPQAKIDEQIQVNIIVLYTNRNRNELTTDALYLRTYLPSANCIYTYVRIYVCMYPSSTYVCSIVYKAVAQTGAPTTNCRSENARKSDASHQVVAVRCQSRSCTRLLAVQCDRCDLSGPSDVSTLLGKENCRSRNVVRDMLKCLHKSDGQPLDVQNFFYAMQDYA